MSKRGRTKLTPPDTRPKNQALETGEESPAYRSKKMSQC